MMLQAVLIAVCLLTTAHYAPPGLRKSSDDTDDLPPFAFLWAKNGGRLRG